MRCKNCGWENDDNSLKCVKCNAPLTGSMASHQPSPSPRRAAENPLMGTVKESAVFNDPYSSAARPFPEAVEPAPSPAQSRPTGCPKCGYPVNPDFKSCPNCGYSFSTGADVPGVPGPAGAAADKPAAAGKKMMGTVNNWLNPGQGVFCTLKPVAWVNEGIEYQPKTYSGDQIVLNRANTDPENQTITSQEQAVLSHDGENWYIENKSSQETTFIKVSRKTRLESGDIIILGNRLFEFKG